MKINKLKKIIESLIPTFYLAGKKSIALSKKLKVFKKKDGTSVTNGDLEVNKIIQKKIKSLTPELEIISEENIKGHIYKKRDNFWLIDPIDGTNGYIKGEKEYTLNAAIILKRKPVAGIIYAPKLNRLFYSYGPRNAYEISGKKKNKLDCKKNIRNTNIGITSSSNPSDYILKILKKNNVVSFKEIRSSLKFCLIAANEYDIYAARPRAKEWDIAAGHAIASHAGAVITTHSNKKILYGKKDFSNPSLLVKRKKLL